MRIPFEWLKEFIDITAPPQDVADRLTMLGFEVESAEAIEGDTVFEVNVTPNRPDCLSILGIARELSSAYKIPLKFPEHTLAADVGELDFNVDILDSELCHRYAGRIVRDLKVGDSPEWLKKGLGKCGIRSINNVVDITNYVLLELGHPLHAFDLETVRGHRIFVATPNRVKGQGSRVKFKALDGIEREIPGDSLLIWDAERPIAIAGVMGGVETEVADSTRDIFIESAYFEPTSVRRTSKALGLRTESSYRFERGTDIKLLKKALERAAFLMKEIAGGTIYGKIDIYPKRFTPREIVVRHERINSILGLRLSVEEICEILKRLGLEIEQSAGQLLIKPPTYRRDLRMEADIIEEIARVYGYDRIPAQLPSATIGIMDSEFGIKNSELRIKKDIKESLLKSGFTEVINFSFMGPQDLELLCLNSNNLSSNDERRSAVEIKNPLRIEDSFMRTTLLPSLIKNMLYNLFHGNRDLRLFEMAKVFISRQSAVGSQQSISELPIEKEHLSAIYYKEKIKTLYRDDTPDFYILKGVVEAILNSLKIYDYYFVKSAEPFLHPGQSADIYLDSNKLQVTSNKLKENNSKDSSLVTRYSLLNEVTPYSLLKKIGYIGALSPLIIESLGIKAHTPSVIVMEIDFDSLIPYAMQEVKYRPLPRHPYIERDTAIIVDETLDASALMNGLKSYPSELIEEIHIFDVYMGKGIPEGEKSIAFSVRYRASDRTLKDEDIETIHSSLVKYIVNRTGGRIRE